MPEPPFKPRSKAELRKSFVERHTMRLMSAQKMGRAEAEAKARQLFRAYQQYRKKRGEPGVFTAREAQIAARLERKAAGLRNALKGKASMEEARALVDFWGACDSKTRAILRKHGITGLNATMEGVLVAMRKFTPRNEREEFEHEYLAPYTIWDSIWHAWGREETEKSASLSVRLSSFPQDRKGVGLSLPLFYPFTNDVMAEWARTKRALRMEDKLNLAQAMNHLPTREKFLGVMANIIAANRHSTVREVLKDLQEAQSINSGGDARELHDFLVALVRQHSRALGLHVKGRRKR